jgi:transposase InsO family protein
MPWKEVSMVDQRREFVSLALTRQVPVTELCRRFGISRDSGHRLLRRHAQQGEAALLPNSRRPHSSPARTPDAMEQQVLVLRDRHPAWGGRKLARRLRDMGLTEVPAPSTITAILHRHGRIDPDQAARHRPWQRFERAAPNELWQMDFKGHIALQQGRCHPLTVIDDHCRYALGLRACADEREPTVRGQLSALFRRYGLPEAILCDNGSP